MTAENLSTIGKSEMCGSLLIKKIISCKLRWNNLPLLLFFFHKTNSLRAMWNLLWEGTCSLSKHPSQSEETRQRWLGRHLPLHTTPRQAWTAGGMPGESEKCRLKSPTGSPAPTTRLIQIPALSFVCPPRLFPAKASMTQVPPCSLEGRYYSQIERIHHLEFFPFYWL